MVWPVVAVRNRTEPASAAARQARQIESIRAAFFLSSELTAEQTRQATIANRGKLLIKLKLFQRSCNYIPEQIERVVVRTPSNRIKLLREILGFRQIGHSPEGVNCSTQDQY